mgnify:CR=1 FL=1
MKDFTKSTFSFVQKFKIFGIISLIVAGIGLGCFIATLFGVSPFNFDIEFVGGVSTTYDLGVKVDSSVTDKIDSIVNDVTGSYASSVQSSGSDGESVLIKTKELDSETRDALFDAVKEVYPNAEAGETQFISASVGDDLKSAAVRASLLAIVLILLYITFRFEFRSGVAAVITLCHDICVMMALFAIFQLPVNMNFIAAALTILGYSINATIVVFDRIRENATGISDLKIFSDITDRSIRQTLARSINTSITTLIPIILILILGVPSIQNFAIALLIGILSGTYSSVFIAGPLWMNLKKIGKKKTAKAKA